MGVFDGHGANGHRVSQYTAEEIPSRLASRMMSWKVYDEDKEGSISAELMTEVYKEVNGSLPYTMQCQSSCISVDGCIWPMPGTARASTYASANPPRRTMGN